MIPVFTIPTEQPKTERIRCLDGSVVWVPAWWGPEFRRAIRREPRNPVEQTIRDELRCKPSEAAEAAGDAQRWLVALGYVVLR
jgi:hypothetical protein